MANVTESAVFETGIYRIETTDPVIGGESGISNLPHKQLANRTQYLKSERDAIVQRLDNAGIGLDTEFTGDLNTLRQTGMFYAGTGHTNGPTGQNGHLFIERRDANNVVQLFFQNNADLVYFRRLSGGTWNAWSRMLTGSTDQDSLVAAGTIIQSARSAPSSGYLKCNGASVSRATYNTLFLAIGLQHDVRRWKRFSAGSPTQVQLTNLLNQFTAAQAVTVQAEVGQSLPTPLVEGTTYYVRVINTTTIQLHPTNTDATNNTNAISLGNDNFFKIADASTFVLPDLRGEFVRGWDDARGIDSGRIFGSSQLDELKSHFHIMKKNNRQVGAGAGFFAMDDAGVDGSENTELTGGAETRPRNIALSFFIKF